MNVSHRRNTCILVILYHPLTHVLEQLKIAARLAAWFLHTRDVVDLFLGVVLCTCASKLPRVQAQVGLEFSINNIQLHTCRRRRVTYLARACGALELHGLNHQTLLLFLQV
jgi:hypothetical protein